MKILIGTTFIALAATFSAPSFAAGDHDSHAAMQAQAPAQVRMVDGVVKKVDKSAAKVTLAHGPLTNLGMPAMTMAFRVKEAAWLGQVKEGDKVRFMADKVDGDFTIVHFEEAK
ncbi:MAG: copper-binding protein [Betaproteobacteria bacterium]|nr:copper-binding protein [Betaproteobacteria bacterium]